MIGLSLSKCIKDILEGSISKDQVSLIITGTRVITDSDWISVHNSYCGSHWKSNPVKAWEIMQELRRAGKIFQPRTIEKYPYRNNVRISLDLYQPSEWVDVNSFWNGSYYYYKPNRLKEKVNSRL